MILRGLLLALVILFSSPIGACDRLIVSGFSYHFDRSSSHNEINYGLGCSKDLDKDLAVSIGAYRNSQFITSKYALLDYTPYHPAPAFSVGLSAGYLDGYSFNKTNIMAAPLVKWQMSKKWTLDGVIVPVQSGLVGVFFEYRL